MSSTGGRLAQVSEEWQKKFASPSLTEEELISYMDQFVQYVFASFCYISGKLLWKSSCEYKM